MQMDCGFTIDGELFEPQPRSNSPSCDGPPTPLYSSLSMRNETQSLSALTALLAQEWTQPAPEAAHVVAAKSNAVTLRPSTPYCFTVLCLRTQQTADAVLDFYVLVRSYRSCYDRPLLRWLNALLPPNVFYIEVGQGTRTLRRSMR